MGWPVQDPSVGDFACVYELRAWVGEHLAWWQNVVETARRVSAASRSVWQGLAGTAFADAVEDIARRGEPVCADLRSWDRLIRRYLQDVAEQLVPQAEKWKAIRAGLEGDLVSARERFEVTAAMGFVPLAEQNEIGRIEGEIADATHRIERLSRWRQEEEDSFAAGMRGLEMVFRAVGGVPAIVAGFGRGTGGASGGGLMDGLGFWLFTDLVSLTPMEVRRRWDLLSDAEREVLIADDPFTFGNLNGVPLGWRAKANGKAIGDYIETVEAERDELAGADVLVGTAAYYSVKAKLSKLQDRIDSLKTLSNLPQDDEDDLRHVLYNEKLKPGTTTRAKVIAFDPGSGGIAFYHGVFDANGDIPAWYKNVAVMVPGTGSNLCSLAGDLRASNLYDQANRTGSATAVITWQGGRFPQGISEAMDRSYANVLDKQLASFVTAAQEGPSSGAAWTVIGHSYGGTVVAQAEVDGLSADRFVYVSSAGMGDMVAPGPSPLAGHQLATALNADQPSNMLTPTGRLSPRWPAATDASGNSVCLPGAPPVSILDALPDSGAAHHYALYADGDMVVGAIQDDGLLHNLHGASPQNDPGITRLETGWMNDGRRSGGLVENSGELPTQKHSLILEPKTTAFKNIVQVVVGGEVSIDHAENHGGDGLNPNDAGYRWITEKVPGKQ